MGMDVGSKSGGVKANINVTPLVDIMLVLLIIFIVITPAVNDSVKLPLAKHSPKMVKNGEKYMTLYFNAKRGEKDGKPDQFLGPGLVTHDDKKKMDARGGKGYDMANPQDREALEAVINETVTPLVEKRVLIKGDADVLFKDVDELFQLARRAGVDEASIVTGEEKKKEGGQ